MTYDEMNPNGDVLDLQCVNGDGWAMVAREHIVAIELDWLVKNGEVTIVTPKRDYVVLYDEGDSGAACSDQYATVTKWLGGSA